METTEVASQCDELERCGSPSSCSDKSGLTPVGENLDSVMTCYYGTHFHSWSSFHVNNEL